MRHAALKWKASIALLALAVLGLLADASAAPFGRPRPTSRPIYGSVHELPHPYQLPNSVPAEQIKPGPVTIPSGQTAPHWEKVTQALGAQTSDPDKAYVVMRVGSEPTLHLHGSRHGGRVGLLGVSAAAIPDDAGGAGVCS